MIVLGIETSCDDTSAAVYDGVRLRSNITSTHLIHQRFGGVVPELASRSHIKLLIPVMEQALSQADVTLKDVQGIAVTYGPGLAGSLLVGLSAAKGLALSLGVPMAGVNHLEGHIWANRLGASAEPPFVVLIASGGHTQLVLTSAWGEYEILGKTRDDAAGEAFDKVGKLLEVGYPGGPFIEKLARKGDAEAVRFPRAFLEEGSYDFSFSGLKTAVLNHVREIGNEETKRRLADISASFQGAVVDVLVAKTMDAAVSRSVSRVCLAGGVAVNKALREAMVRAGKPNGISVYWPPPDMCTDNGGMIAAVGHHYLGQGISSSLSLSPLPSLNL